MFSAHTLLRVLCERAHNESGVNEEDFPEEKSRVRMILQPPAPASKRFTTDGTRQDRVGLQ